MKFSTSFPFLRILCLGLTIVGFSNLAIAQQQTPGAPVEVYTLNEVLEAADTFFEGQNREGLERVLAQAFSDMGAPEAYLMGVENEGLTEIGYRYGEGRLFHKGVGQEPVYWKGPSIGFDLAGHTRIFVLVYNLNDYKSFYKRFHPGERGYFFYNGVALSYRKRLEMTLAQIMVGVEVSEGLNPAWIKYGPDKLVVPNVLPD